jgi:hypothetical protein
MRLTHPIRTAWDLAAWLDAPQAVAIIDAMVASRLLDHHEAMAFAASRRGRRWHRRVSRVFELVDGRAQSPPESHLRVQLMTAGLPRPTPQLAVPVPGLVLHPDLAWPEWKVAVEYVGRWHHQEEQFHRDRRRLNLLVADGWLVLHVTHDRLRSDTAGMVREIRAALTARGWRGWRG